MDIINCRPFGAKLSEKACSANLGAAGEAYQNFIAFGAKPDGVGLDRLMVCSGCRRAKGKNFYLLDIESFAKIILNRERRKIIGLKPVSYYDYSSRQHRKRLAKIRCARKKAGMEPEPVPETGSDWFDPEDMYNLGGSSTDAGRLVREAV